MVAEKERLKAARRRCFEDQSAVDRKEVERPDRSQPGDVERLKSRVNR
jgi:hypothetical protein